MDDLKDIARQLVTRYAEQGLGGISAVEVPLLLSEKQLHLSEVSERCQQGHEMHLNVPLKRALDGEVREIGSYEAFQQLLEDFEEQLGKVRPVTRNLVESVMLDAWPRNAAIVDFGIDSQKHYEALYYPIRKGEIMPGQLDLALGNGPMLTELTRNAPSNPHREVEFHGALDWRLDGPQINQEAQKAIFAEMTEDYAAAKERDYQNMLKGKSIQAKDGRDEPER